MLVAAAGVVDEATMRNMLPIRCGVVDPQQTRSGAAEFGKIKNVVTLDMLLLQFGISSHSTSDIHLLLVPLNVI